MGTKMTPWLGRFTAPVMRRVRGSFHTATACTMQGEPRLVVFTDPARPGERLREALGRFARAHGQIEHPRIARLAEHGEHEGVAFAALDCDADRDLGALLRLSRRAARRTPHAQADGFIRGLREALQAAHRHHDEDGPLCLGVLSYANVVFNRAGRHWLLGFGHNVMTHDEDGLLMTSEPVFQAPELTMGEGPSPAGDFVALILMMRSTLSTVSLAPAVARAVLGRSLREDVELVRCLLWFERRVMAALPSQRATIAEAIEVSDRIRELLGVVPDAPGFERIAAGLFAGQEADADRRELRVGPDASWVELSGGVRLPIESRFAMRRVLLALADAHARQPGRSLPIDALIAAGWPGERLRGETGINRTHVMLSELRRMGLRDVLQRDEQGYRLDPALRIQRVESED